MSEIISDEPKKGQDSVDPKLSTNLNWVTPFENKNFLVRLGYFVATLNLFFFFSLKVNETSSKSAIVWTSIHRSGIARTKSARPNLYFLLTLIFFWILVLLSFKRSKPEKPTSRDSSASLSIISLACKNIIFIFLFFFTKANKSLSPLSEINLKCLFYI